MADRGEHSATRTWGPVIAVVLLLPLVFVGMRACLPPIGGREAPAPVPEERTGSAACEACHEAEHRAWSGSTHARAEQPLDETSLAPLDGGMLELDTAGGSASVVPVRTIGVDPLWQYLVPMDNGRLQVTSAAWDPARGEWFEIFADARSPGDWGHWTGGAMTWNAQCASCHDTGVDKGLAIDADGLPTYQTTVREHGVGCAACHGQAEDHVEGGPPPEVAAERWLDVCASCHARRAELTGRFEPGEAFLDHFRPDVVDLTDAFWPDGQVRDEDFEYTAFIGSTMHARGVSCTACHDAHSGDLVREGDALCLGCHESMDFAEHDPHEPTVGCDGCHLPVTTYMQRDPRHDHGFIVPDPGIAGVPDVCTRCHEDRDASWAASVADRWWPDRPRARRERANRMSAARRGEVTAIPGLLVQLREAEAPAWRASAAAALGGFVGTDEVVAGLLAAAEDPAPLVRMAATESLAPRFDLVEVQRALRTRLTDPRTAVRVAAARGLRQELARDDPRARDFRGYLEHNRDQPAALLDASSWQLARAQPRAAVKTLRRALVLDPRSPTLYDQLAIAHARLGAMDEAVEAMEAAVEAGADDADTWFRLGLGRSGAGDSAGAREALRRAVQRDPTHPRAAYNLAVLLAQSGQVDEALATLEEAARHQPDSVDIQNAIRHYRSRRQRP